jgi:hypothetical protein
MAKIDIIKLILQIIAGIVILTIVYFLVHYLRYIPL